MNIEQMLLDAIERKTAKILKEEYGLVQITNGTLGVFVVLVKS